jgi:hypothetical protein
MRTTRVRVLDDAALSWASRIVWLICVAVYLTVFIGGIQAGGADLEVMGRAVAFTLAAGVLGRMAIGVLSRASLPAEEGPSAEQVGPVGSLVDLVGSTNFGQHEDDEAASAS